MKLDKKELIMKNLEENAQISCTFKSFFEEFVLLPDLPQGFKSVVYFNFYNAK